LCNRTAVYVYLEHTGRLGELCLSHRDDTNGSVAAKVPSGVIIQNGEVLLKDDRGEDLALDNLTLSIVTRNVGSHNGLEVRLDALRGPKAIPKIHRFRRKASMAEEAESNVLMVICAVATVTVLGVPVSGVVNDNTPEPSRCNVVF